MGLGTFWNLYACESYCYVNIHSAHMHICVYKYLVLTSGGGTGDSLSFSVFSERLLWRPT